MTRFLKLVRHQNGSWQALPTDTDEDLNLSVFDDHDAPIDPDHLLKALDPLLFDDGGIKEASATQFSSDASYLDLAWGKLLLEWSFSFHPVLIMFLFSIPAPVLEDCRAASAHSRKISKSQNFKVYYKRYLVSVADQDNLEPLNHWLQTSDRDADQDLESLMKKFSKKLVSRCVYVNVLTVTKPDVLEKLLDQGGWSTLNSWLTDAKETNNLSLLMRLLGLCKLLPMTVERLKENNTPKIVKSLSKVDSDDVKVLSHELVTKWMTIIKGEAAINNVIENKKKKKLKTTKENSKEPKKHSKRESPTKERKESFSSENLEENEELPKPAAKVRGLKRASSDKSMSPENFYGDPKAESKEEPALKKCKTERTRKPSSDKTPEEPSVETKTEPKPDPLPKRTRIERIKTTTNNKNVSSERLEDVKVETKPDPLPKRTRIERFKTTTNSKNVSAELLVDVKVEIKPDPLPKRTRIERVKTTTNSKNVSAELLEDVKVEIKPDPLPKRTRIERVKTTTNSKNVSAELLEDVKIEIKSDLLPKKPRADRPKTVKSFGAKFRATGLEEAAPLPKKIAKKTPTVDKNAAAAVAKSVVTKRLNSLFPERITEKKIKPETLLNINETPTPAGGIKLIPAKPRPTHILQESASFMDALVAQPSVPVIKKKKKPVKPTTPPPTSPPVKPPKLQFYKDTLEMNTEESTSTEEEKPKKEGEEESEGDAAESSNKEVEVKKETDEDPAPPPDDTEAPATEINIEDSINKEIKKEIEEAIEAKDENIKVAETPVSGELKSILSHHRRRRPKKSVRWVEEDNLKEMFYFELDETERVNVLRSRPFGDLKTLEAKREREAFEAAKRQAGDKMEETMPWSMPLLIDIAPPLVEPGYLSQEKEIQLIRHQSVLQAIYFSRESVPDSPQEPDPEIVIPQEAKIIPLDEENMVGSVMDYSAQTMPTPKLPDVLSSLINIPLSRPPPILPNHIDQNVLNTTVAMMQQQGTPLSPTAPYDPGEPMSHVPLNIAQMNSPPPQQQMPPQPMFNAPPRMMVDPEPRMPAPNNWGNMDSSLMGPPPERFFQPGAFPMNPYPMMETNMPPNIPHMGGGGGGGGMRRMGGNRMIRPMGKNPPYHPRQGGPRRGMPHIPCRHFLAGGCRFGSNCNFLHPGVNGPA